jgi:hypothetical protein
MKKQPDDESSHVQFLNSTPDKAVGAEWIDATGHEWVIVKPFYKWWMIKTMLEISGVTNQNVANN